MKIKASSHLTKDGLISALKDALKREEEKDELINELRLMLENEERRFADLRGEQSWPRKV